MKLTYEQFFEYKEERIPNACFGKGDRKSYTLTTKSEDKVSEKFGINAYSEYGTTLNIFANGYANIMKMKYNHYDEEFVEYEIYSLSQEELKNIKLVEE